jgi:hypothetical protein
MAANIPRISNKGSLGAFTNKKIPNTMPTKLKGKSHFNSWIFASLDDFLPMYSEAQISMMTIMGTTTLRGYICTSKGTATIDEPNPETPKMKNPQRTIKADSANEAGSINSKILSLYQNSLARLHHRKLNWPVFNF